MTQDEFDARFEEGDRKGWVYLIQARSGGPIKIGWARDPERRLLDLQTGQAEQLTLLAVIPGTKRLEHDIHRKLIYARLGGEWFQANEVTRVLRPVIAEYGLKLVARAAQSRNSPERRRYGQFEKQEFIVELSGVS